MKLSLQDRFDLFDAFTWIIFILDDLKLTNNGNKYMSLSYNIILVNEHTLIITNIKVNTIIKTTIIK